MIEFFQKANDVLIKVWDTITAIFSIIPKIVQFVINQISLLPPTISAPLGIVLAIGIGVLIYRFVR